MLLELNSVEKQSMVVPKEKPLLIVVEREDSVGRRLADLARMVQIFPRLLKPGADTLYVPKNTHKPNQFEEFDLTVDKRDIGLVFPGNFEIGPLLPAEPEQREATIARAKEEALKLERDRKIFESAGPNSSAMAARRNGDMAASERFEAERDKIL